jgi:hypothetical protein
MVFGMGCLSGGINVLKKENLETKNQKHIL